MFQESKELSVQEIVHPCLPRWRARIDAAEKRGCFDEYDEYAADHWGMCAVGEAFRMSPRVERDGTMENSPPADVTLFNLGHQFAEIVEPDSKDFARAREILSAIEARLSEIL